MKTILSILIFLSFFGTTFAQEQNVVDNLNLNEVATSIEETVEEIVKVVDQNTVLVGTETGLYQLIGTTQNPLWQEGYVQKILKADGWFFLTSEGIVYSKDLVNFEKRNSGLPAHTIKKYDGKVFSSRGCNKRGAGALY